MAPMPSATRSCPACQTPLPDEAQFCMHCGKATPTDPGVPPRTATTGVFEVSQVRKALASRYRIERVLGEGGMATVYLAEDLKHHRKVAVKVMRPELAATLGADRFLREIEIAAQLSHPNILPVYDSGEAEGQETRDARDEASSRVSRPSSLLYYVMPYVEGGTVRDRLQKDSQLPVGEAVRLAREVAEALAYAHARGIIHRDIKPANVLLGAGHALVADFGIARALGAEGEALTRTGLAVGTPHYMAPEQSSGDREVDGRADVYAVGSVLYEMLAGEPPFTGPSARAIITRSMTERPRPITATRSEVPAAIEAVVLKALAKGPADRYPTADAMIDALDRAVESARTPMPGTISAATPAASPAAVTSPGKAWAVFGIGAAAAMGVVYAAVARWQLPSWVLMLAAVLLAIGAGVMLMTTRAESQRRNGRDTPGLSRLFTWRNAATGGFLALGLWTLIATAFMLRGPPGVAGGVVRLAVLPFENRGAEADAYFVDGVTDEVRSKLTRLPQFQVIARSSSDQYRETEKSLAQIADELGVDYLLTGTVSWIKPANGSGRVQVSPELMEVRTGAAKWKERFDTELTDVVTVQTSIATQVASALGVALGGSDQQHLAERPTRNTTAYDLYLKGKALVDRNPTVQRVAASHFEQAVALDDSFAQGWAGLATSLSIVYSNGNRDPGVARRAKEAADRAVALAPDQVDGHLALADYFTNVVVDANQAKAHSEAAIRIDPNNALALRGMARIDANEGRVEESLAQLRKALSIDPRSPSLAQSLLFTLVRFGKYAEALEAAKTTAALSPDDLQSLHFEAMTHLALGDLAAARAVIRRGLSVVPAPALVSQVSGFFETAWVLDEKEQQLLYRLTPAAFDEDRAWWAQTLATSHWDAGNRSRAVAYADSALVPTESQVRANPGDAQLQALYGVMLAYLGRRQEAVAAGRRAVDLLTASRDMRNLPYIYVQVARIHLALGEQDAALDIVEKQLNSSPQLTPGWLRLDPMYGTVRGNARFAALVGR